MKNSFLTALLLLAVSSCFSTNYYVSPSGNDGNSGTSPAAPWLSIARLNTAMASMSAGDSVLFQRGGTFYGRLVVSRNNLNFDAYGTGSLPVITGYTTVASWTADAMPGVYRTSVNAKPTLMMVSWNGTPQRMGRYPNPDQAEGGYLKFEGNDVSLRTITDNQLGFSPDWTGAEVVIRGNDWTADRCIIQAHKGQIIYYRMGRGTNAGVTSQFSIINNNYGYFIQNDKRTLDQPGEWWFDSTNKQLYIYSGATAPGGSVRVATIDTLADCGSRSFLSFRNLKFEGANRSGIYSLNGSSITVTDCEFEHIGSRAVHFWLTGNAYIGNVKTNWTMSNAIQVRARTKNNVWVRKCTVRNNGRYIGMGSFFDYSDYVGIIAQATSGVAVDSNFVDSSGSSGIDVNGSDVICERNIITNYCLVVHDKGAIYTFVMPGTANAESTLTNRIIQDNICLFAKGDANGTNRTVTDAAGIYLDGITPNFIVRRNIVANITGFGIYCNNPRNVSILDNLSYNNTHAIGLTRYDYATLNNVIVKFNTCYAAAADQDLLKLTNQALNYPVTTSVSSWIKSIGVIDSNYYGGLNEVPFRLEIYPTKGSAPLPWALMSRGAWTTLSGYDAASKSLPQFSPFTVSSIVSANLITNGTFNTSTTGWTLFGSNTNFTWSTGAGRLSFLSPVAGRFSLIHQRAGAISASKKYLLRWTTSGTSFGSMQLFLRNSVSPWNDLTPRQVRAFSAGTKAHQVLFTVPSNVPAGSIALAVEQSSGTTMLDNIQFNEVLATVNNLQDSVQLFVNTSASPVTHYFNSVMTDAIGSTYRGAVSLPPCSGKLLFFRQPITVKTSSYLIRKRR